MAQKLPIIPQNACCHTNMENQVLSIYFLIRTVT